MLIGLPLRIVLPAADGGETRGRRCGPARAWRWSVLSDHRFSGCSSRWPLGGALLVTARKSSGLAGSAAPIARRCPRPCPSNGSSIPLSGSSSNRPEALLGAVNAMASGSRRRVTV